MALEPGDLTLSVLPTDTEKNKISCVVGRSTTLKVNFQNLSPTDPIYSMNFSILLPDGISFVSSSLIPSETSIDKSFNKTITFYNIKDLYPNELNYSITVTLKIDEKFESNNLNVPFDYTFSNIKFSVSGNSKPRGNIDENNTTIDSETIFTMNALRYEIKLKYPNAYIKGAGTQSSDSVDATSIFYVSAELINTTRTTSNVSIIINLANGLRYMGVWETTGTNAINFANPTIENVSSTQDHIKILLANKTLSPSSSTTLSFQVAIWNRYTINGQENSGDLITFNSPLVNTINISGNNLSYIYSFTINSLDVSISQITETTTTDVNLLNEYTLTFSVSEYYPLYNFTLTFTIPDGMSYSENIATTPTPKVSTVGNTTVLSWNYETILENTDNQIKVYTTTNSTYADNTPVYATDSFMTLLEAFYISPDSEEMKSISDEFIMMCAAPIITTNVLGYYYSNLKEKNFNVATVGDYVEFSITYDASNITAIQRQVNLFAYPPLNIDTETVTNITATGDVPEEITYEAMPDNGVIIPLGDLAGGTNFTISYYIQVTNTTDEPTIYSLAKAVLQNKNDISYALRDSSLVYFGIPQLRITKFLNSTNCVKLNNEYIYTIIIDNFTDDGNNYVSDSFNISFSSIIPDIFEITSPPIVMGTATFDDIIVENNNLSMNIEKIGPDENIEIEINLTVNALPIMGKAYTMLTSITNGTSQSDTDSYKYTENKFPLDVSYTITACKPSINKSYIPSTINLGNTYKSVVTVVFPEGALAFNTKIKDSLVTTDSSNLTNVLLNGEPAKYTLTTNNITVPLNEMLDTSSGEIKYVFEYDDKTLTGTPKNYEQTRFTPSSIDWSEEENMPETYSESIVSNIKVLFPGITCKKEQRNVTQNIPYDIYPIRASLGDVIDYRITLQNIGKAPAYDIDISDYISENLNYISNTIDAIFDEQSRILTANVESIPSGSDISFTIRCSVNNVDINNISENLYTSTYKANPSFKKIYASPKSNGTTLYYDIPLMITKYHQNATLGEPFTTNIIKCYINQTVKYKLSITNTLDTPITNIAIIDTFPEEFSFKQIDSSTGGDTAISGNIIKTSLDTLNPGESFEYIYSVVLSSNTLSRKTSVSTMSYTFPNEVNTHEEISNSLIIILAGLGRGFLVY